MNKIMKYLYLILVCVIFQNLAYSQVLMKVKNQDIYTYGGIFTFNNTLFCIGQSNSSKSEGLFKYNSTIDSFEILFDGKLNPVWGYYGFNKNVFLAGNNYWVMDQSFGIKKLIDCNYYFPYFPYVQPHVTNGNLWYFSCDKGEILATDGTVGGTSIVLNLGVLSEINAIRLCKDRLIISYYLNNVYKIAIYNLMSKQLFKLDGLSFSLVYSYYENVSIDSTFYFSCDQTAVKCDTTVDGIKLISLPGRGITNIDSLIFFYSDKGINKLNLKNNKQSLIYSGACYLLRNGGGPSSFLNDGTNIMFHKYVNNSLDRIFSYNIQTNLLDSFDFKKGIWHSLQKDNFIYSIVPNSGIFKTNISNIGSTSQLCDFSKYNLNYIDTFSIRLFDNKLFFSGAENGIHNIYYLDLNKTSTKDKIVSKKYWDIRTTSSEINGVSHNYDTRYKDVSLQVYSISGERILKKSFSNSNQFNCDIGNLPAGNYVGLLDFDVYHESFKFIKL